MTSLLLFILLYTTYSVRSFVFQSKHVSNLGEDGKRRSANCFSVENDEIIPEKLPFYRWLSKLVYEEPQNLYQDPFTHFNETINTVNDTGCIINTFPARTVLPKMIDFNLTHTVESIIGQTWEPAHTRNKPVIVVVRGIGGGKSRCLEEVRRCLLLHGKGEILPLAITFNHKSKPGDDFWLKQIVEDKTVVLQEHEKLQLFGISVVTRMLSAVFGIPYDEMTLRIGEEMSTLDLRDVRNPKRAIQEALRFVIKRLKESREKLQVTGDGDRPKVPPVDTVVFMIDDSSSADKYLNTDDLARILRRIFLDEEVLPGIKSTLVMSSLNSLPYDLMLTLSSRCIEAVELPVRLNADAVVNNWWQVNTATAAEKNTLKLIAATMNSMPRALETAATYFSRSLILADKEVSDHQKPIAIDGVFVQNMYSYLFDGIASRLIDVSEKTPTLRLLSMLFFRQRVRLDDEELLAAISESIVTNPITAFNTSSAIIPDTSIVMLKVVARRILDEPATVSTSSTVEVAQDIDSGIQAILDTITSRKAIGDILEVTLRHLLHIRTRLYLGANRADRGTGTAFGRLKALARRFIGGFTKKKEPQNLLQEMTLARLYGLEKVLMFENITSMLNPSIRQVLDRKLSWREDAKCFVYALNSCVYSGITAEIDALMVNDTHPVALIMPHNNRNLKVDTWDVCIKCHMSSKEPPFYIFFDAKSGNEDPDTMSNVFVDQVLSNPRQLSLTRQALNASRPFVFIYLSTHETPSRTLVNKKRNGSSGSSCIVLGRTASLELLGPFAELYKVASEEAQSLTQISAVSN